MFNEITGSLSVLAKFSGRETKDSTIDEVLQSTPISKFQYQNIQNKPDLTRESKHFMMLNDSTINDALVLSEDENNIPYQYTVQDKSRQRLMKNRTKIRINSLSPISMHSSAIENEYDIIRDDIGYSHLVGKVFYYSIRSNNSSKYVSEESKLK
jgi:hypothetical protein